VFLPDLSSTLSPVLTRVTIHLPPGLHPFLFYTPTFPQKMYPVTKKQKKLLQEVVSSLSKEVIKNTMGKFFVGFLN
jgi:hypothetical protein